MNLTVTDICSFNTKFNKMEEDKKLKQNLDNSNEKLHISDVISSKTTDWDDIFQNVSEGSGLYRLPSGNYIPLKTYLKEKYHPPKIK